MGFDLTYRLVSIVFFSLGVFFGGCDEFFTKNVAFGGNIPNRTGSGTGGDTGSTDDDSGAPSDDDADGLSNEIERTIGTDTVKADTDHDGFDDGLEFVGRLGDPLNGRLSPTAFGRERILTGTEVIQNDVDGDGDGLGDRIEALRSLNADSPDTDEDGYQDGLEVIAGSDPLISTSRPVRSNPPVSDGVVQAGSPPADLDRDGIADDLESLNGGSTTSRDTDRDGYSDGIEFLFGSTASDPASIPDFSSAALQQTTEDDIF